MTSCDPAKLIIMKNKSNKQVKVIWTIVVDSVSSDLNIKAIRTSIYDLGIEKDRREASMIFGFGTWPVNEIERFVNDQVKSLIIEGSKTKIVLTNKNEINEYLKARRQGILGNFIVIKVY
jgi:hypothetical protein